MATGDPGTDASVTNSGTDQNAVLDFVIPRGDTGASGAQAQALNAYSTPASPGTAGNPLVFDQNAAVSGTAISHTAGTAPFTISQPGMYNVAFNGTVSPVTGATVPQEIRLYLEQDGTALPGATASQTFQSDSDSDSLAFSQIVQVTTTPSVLQVVGSGGNFLYSDASLSVHQIGTAS